MKSILHFFLFLSLLTGGCKNNTEQKSQSNETPPDSTSAPSYTLSPFRPSRDFPDASLKAMAYNGGTFSTVIGGASYKLGEQTSDAEEKQCANSKEGQHLHLIVDSEPYVAKYESSFTYDIPDGHHYLLCFLSRSYHESIKTKEAHRVVNATIRDKSIVKNDVVTEPMLFYSRPKGLYSGDDTKKVMLDFYLVNAEMPKYTVEADINGQKFTLDRWQPYYIEGLPEGDNTIMLTLLDSAGQKVPSPLNPVTRKFQIEKTPVAK